MVVRGFGYSETYTCKEVWFTEKQLFCSVSFLWWFLNFSGSRNNAGVTRWKLFGSFSYYMRFTSCLLSAMVANAFGR